MRISARTASLGLGIRSSDRRRLSLSDYALALAQAIRRESDDPVVAVGHSLGGLIALRLAVQDQPLSLACSCSIPPR
jgi:alpha-beta hydrolase superfamily lysophospholipase